jgi:hypothetical protein
MRFYSAFKGLNPVVHKVTMGPKWLNTTPQFFHIYEPPLETLLK